ncbi:hypothetical protein RUND412_007640, partial [Rhizina undulata]
FENISNQEGLTMEVAFYAMMGGFVFKDDSADSNSFTLQYNQFFKLVKDFHLSKPTLKKLDQEVKNLSNTECLAKVLACLQASWFVVQCFARKATGLPVTLIELHTTTHVITASISRFMLTKAFMGGRLTGLD